MFRKIEMAVQFFVKFTKIRFHRNLWFCGVIYIQRERERETEIFKDALRHMSMPRKSYEKT
jgi:hypothetical protein